jgi:hypothetical protein
MPNMPAHLRGHLVTPSSREEIFEANARTIRDEVEEQKVLFDELTAHLKNLRKARGRVGKTHN